MVDITGTISALSHSFRLSDGYQLFLRLDTEGKTCYVLVKEPKLQEWHKHIEVAATYSIKCLHQENIHLGSQSLHVYKTCCRSSLERLHKKELQVDQMKEHYRSMQSQVLSCKAKVSEVIDAEAGIYLLSNNMKLYTTFLKDLTGELWSEGQSEESADAKDASHCSEASSSSTSEHSNLYKCLTPGDNIKIFRCHYTIEKEKVALVCCGQSHIVNESRKFVLKTFATEGISWVTDAVRSLNLGLKGLLWLLRLKEELHSILPSHGLSNQTAAGGSYIMTSLLNEAKRRNLMTKKTRSLVEEFLQPDHKCNCGLMQDSPPFHLATLNNILPDQTQNASQSSSNGGHQVVGDITIDLSQQGSQFSDFWDFSISQKKETPLVLVGKLTGDHGGVLQLMQKDMSMGLIIIGNAGMAASKLGSTVALFDYYVVKEFFFKIKNDPDVQKLYIVVKDSDFFLLEEPKATPSLPEESNRYRLKLLSKSALNFRHSKLKELPLSQFVDIKLFWGMTTIMKLGLKGEVLEKWQRVVEFSGESANLYPLLEVGDECELRIPPSLKPEIALKKSQAFQSMKNFLEHECLLLPAEILMTKVSSETMNCGEVTVQQVKREGHDSELITISGTVLCKRFDSPKFRSEVCEIPLNICNEYHIGVPGSMNFKLLLQDENSPETEVWLYVTCSTNYYMKGYPLFVLPGVRILATDVRRMVAKTSKNVYLISSDFTRIIPLSVPESEQTLQTDSPSTFLKSAYFTLRNISFRNNTFMIYARIKKIIRATMKTVCKYCNYDLVENSDSCDNCFGSSPVDVEASLEVLVDDGTDTGLILLKGMTQIAVLLGLTKKDNTKLYNMIVSQCLHLNYPAVVSQSSQNCKHKFSNSIGFERMITHRDPEHSYRFMCRKQESQPHLCLDLSKLRPMQDIAYLSECR